jgi:hypothetical protein
MRRLPGGASGRCPGRRASPWSGRPRCPPYRPLPVLVHHWVSTRSGVQPSGVQPSGVQPSGVRPSGVRPSGVRPSGVRPSGVRSPGSIVRDRPVRPSGAARPASSRLVSARPSCGVRPVPGQPAAALGITPVRQGLHGWSGSGSVWPAAGPSGSSTAEEAWTQATLRRSWVRRWGGAGRGPGPGCARAEAAAVPGR